MFNVNPEHEIVFRPIISKQLHVMPSTRWVKTCGGAIQNSHVALGIAMSNQRYSIRFDDDVIPKERDDDERFTRTWRGKRVLEKIPQALELEEKRDSV